MPEPSKGPEGQIDTKPAADTKPAGNPSVADITSILAEGNGQLEGGDTEKAAKPDDHQEKVKEPTFDELLADKLEGKKPEGGTEGEGGDTSKAPSTLAELAETAGIKLEDLYKLEVPMQDGLEPITLGTLKDHNADFATLTDDRAELDDRTTEFENGMLLAKQELQQVLSMIPQDQLSPKLIAKAKVAHLNMVESERAAMFDIMPSWADDKVYGKAQTDMLSYVSRYGFSKADLESVHNHRFSKLIYDAMKNQNRIDSANAAMKKQRDSGKASTKGKGTSQKPAADLLGGNPETVPGKVGAISNVLAEAFS